MKVLVTQAVLKIIRAAKILVVNKYLTYRSNPEKFINNRQKTKKTNKNGKKNNKRNF